MNCRSIPEDLWLAASKALVFYFSRRHGRSNAEDLAQDTLAVIWKRSDFNFESQEQFLRVVYGFASRISKQAYRRARKHGGDNLDTDVSARQPRLVGLAGAEVAVFFKDVCREGEAGLSDEDWQLVQKLMESDVSQVYESFGLSDSNGLRVRLHRIRRKLSGLSGFPMKAKKNRITMKSPEKGTDRKEPLEG